MKNSFADILKSVDEQSFRKLFAKVPEWEGTPGLKFPSKLSTEQCSSSGTARCKAALIPSGSCIADLTGGLGVDSWAFSAVCSEVFYNEMDTELAGCVRANYEKLGITNVRFSNREINPGNVREILGDYRPDVIFLDPARRSDAGRKVFLLEDCRPDILSLRDELLDCAPLVIVKLSPMADISLVARQLGPYVRDIHVVGAGGECKELVVVMDRDSHEEYGITVFENGSSFSFTPAEENAARPVPAPESLAGKILFEPGKALMKAGAYNLLCSRGFTKLGRSTHLYICDAPVPEFTDLGKWFRIGDVRELNNRSVREAGKEFPKCEMTARNIPMTTEQLRKKMGSASGGTVHIFAVRFDTTASNILLVTERIRP